MDAADSVAEEMNENLHRPFDGIFLIVILLLRTNGCFYLIHH